MKGLQMKTIKKIFGFDPASEDGTLPFVLTLTEHDKDVDSLQKELGSSATLVGFDIPNSPNVHMSPEELYQFQLRMKAGVEKLKEKIKNERS